MRDVRSAAKRADIIIVSKSPKDLDEVKKAEIIQKLHPLPQQKVFFSSITYEDLEVISQAADQIDPKAADAALLFCGIARPQPLVEELKRRYRQVEVMTFSDHHPYSENDVESILKRYQEMDGTNKIIVTTEKDYARFINSTYLCQFDSVPLFVVPIKTKIHEEEKFNEEILNYVRKNSNHS